MAKKNILNENPSGEEVKEKPVKKTTRLSNADIYELLKSTSAAIEKERNIRTTVANVVDKESSFQLNGVVSTIKNKHYTFET